MEEDRDHYRLDTQQVLNALESGSDLEQITDFLVRRHEGPLPTEVTDWLEEVRANSRAFKSAGQALFIRASSQALLQLATEDPTLSKFAKRLEGRTLVIPVNREKVFRERLKELGYPLA